MQEHPESTPAEQRTDEQPAYRSAAEVMAQVGDVAKAGGGALTIHYALKGAKALDSAAGKLLRPKPEEPSSIEQVHGYRPKQG